MEAVKSNLLNSVKDLGYNTETVLHPDLLIRSVAVASDGFSVSFKALFLFYFSVI